MFSLFYLLSAKKYVAAKGVKWYYIWSGHLCKELQYRLITASIEVKLA